MTATIESLKAKMTSIVHSGKGQLILISPEALKQADELLACLIKVTGYDESKITQDDLDLAEIVIGAFTPEGITGTVVDDVLRPTTDEVHQESLNEIKRMRVDAPSSNYVTAVILGDVLAELKQFYR